MNLPHYKLLRYFSKVEPDAKYSLSASDCEPLEIKDLWGFEKGAEKKLKELKLSYPSLQGGEALRKAISKQYTHISPKQVLVTTGSEEAIFLFLSTLLKKGDHLIVQTPCYQPYYEIPRAMGCEVSFWQGNEEKEWAYEIKDLEKLIQKNTRLITLSSPAHPTGHLMTTKGLFDLVELAREYRLHLFCDESYHGLEHFSQERLPKVADIYEKGFSMGSLSKAYGLPGLRIGWIATTEKIPLLEMSAMKDYTTAGCSSISEFLGEIALKHGEKILANNVKLIQSNTKLFHDFLNEHRKLFACNIPRAGCLALARLKKGSADDLSAGLLESADLLCVSSTALDFGNRHIRIGLGRKNFPRALEQLEKYLGASAQMRRAG